MHERLKLKLLHNASIKRIYSVLVGKKIGIDLNLKLSGCGAISEVIALNGFKLMV